MPDGNENSPEQNEATTDSPQASTEAQPGDEQNAPEQPRGADGRFENPNDPPWARGRSREEILQLTTQLMETLPTLDTSQQQPQQQTPNFGPQPQQTQQQQMPQPQMQQQPQSQLPPRPPAKLMWDDPEEYQRQFERYNEARTQQMLQQQAQQFAQPMMQSQAQTAREMSRRDPEYSDVWERFGHEIDQQMANVPFQQRTKQAYDTVAQMIRGRHWQEFADDYAKSQQRRGGSVTERSGMASTTDATPNPQSPLDELWASGGQTVQRFKDAGITKDMLRQKIRRMGKSEEDYVEALKRDNVIFSGTGKGRAATTKVS